MSAPAPKCPHCHDTGSLSKQLEGGDLDCGHCEVATTRAELEAWCKANIPKGASKATAAWLIYQHGHTAGFTESQLFG